MPFASERDQTFDENLAGLGRSSAGTRNADFDDPANVAISQEVVT